MKNKEEVILISHKDKKVRYKYRGWVLIFVLEGDAVKLKYAGPPANESMTQEEWIGRGKVPPSDILGVVQIEAEKLLLGRKIYKEINKEKKKKDKKEKRGRSFGHCH